MANPILKGRELGSFNVTKTKRFLVPQIAVYAGNTSSGVIGRGHASIPFTQYSMRAIGVQMNLTQGTTWDLVFATNLGNTDNAALTFTPIANAGGSFYLCHKDSDKCWYKRPGVTAKTANTALQLVFPSGPYFTQTAADTTFPSTNRGVSPKFKVSSACTGTLLWFTVVDAISEDL